jgi:DNA-binding IclR family transcriptional regulator
MAAARDELNETIQLAILDGIDNVYIAKVEAGHPLRLVSDVGTRLPAYATGLGKVLLAALPPQELRARFAGVKLQRFTDKTVTTFTKMERALAETRASGIGQDEGEYTPGVFCVAAPIRDYRGSVVAAMSCSVPDVRLAADHGSADRLRKAIVEHARNISRDLGWSGSDAF